LKEKRTKLPYFKVFFGFANLQDQKMNSLKIIIINLFFASPQNGFYFPSKKDSLKMMMMMMMISFLIHFLQAQEPKEIGI